METKRPLAKFDPKKVNKENHNQLHRYDIKKFEKSINKEKQNLDKSLNEIPDPKNETDIHKRVELKAKQKKMKILKDYMASEHVNTVLFNQLVLFE